MYLWEVGNTSPGTSYVTAAEKWLSCPDSAILFRTQLLKEVVNAETE